MIRIITEIVEVIHDGRQSWKIQTEIKGDTTSTEKEFVLAKATADMMDGIMEKAHKAAKKSGMEFKKVMKSD